MQQDPICSCGYAAEPEVLAAVFTGPTHRACVRPLRCRVHTLNQASEGRFLQSGYITARVGISSAAMLLLVRKDWDPL
jgi:hypothetical protein